MNLLNRKKEEQELDTVGKVKEYRRLKARADVWEGPEKFEVQLELPGVRSREDIHLSLEEDVLEVLAPLNREPGSLAEHLATGEELAYARGFRLGSVIDQDKIEASFQDGVLRVVLPKQEKGKARKIEIA